VVVRPTPLAAAISPRTRAGAVTTRTPNPRSHPPLSPGVTAERWRTRGAHATGLFSDAKSATFVELSQPDGDGGS